MAILNVRAMQLGSKHSDCIGSEERQFGEFFFKTMQLLY